MEKTIISHQQVILTIDGIANGEKRTTQRKSKLPSMQEMAQKQFGLLQKRNEKYCQHLWRIWRSRENENQNCICEVENKSNGK